ncbi:MAG: ribosome recycling factor [Bacteroidales bacterium]|nr:ribosome recycling factor [Bacteroidales bacterium]MBN2698676.1 ribosome recycling factor [Bacteroidales bacterium]
MNEEVQMVYEMALEKMEKAVEHLETELSRIRAGKANPHILDGILVEYYGTPTPLNQVSNISTPDGKTIAIQPWEKKMIELIEKAIQNSKVGITPINNGEIIRLNIPPLTEERRIQLVRQVKAEGENARVSIRTSRREANEEYKQMQKDGLSEDLAKKAEEEIQKLTQEYTEKIDRIVENKEQDIMTI